MWMYLEHVKLGIAIFAAFLVCCCYAGETTEHPFDRSPDLVFISEPPTNVDFANTKGTKIPCTAYGRPAPVLEWVLGDGTPVDDVDRLLTVLPNNTLVFHAFDDSRLIASVHAQIYRCLASNAAGTITSRNVSVNAVVINKYRDYGVQLNDKWVMRGATAVLHCEINPYYLKNYVDVIGWSRGTQRVQPGGRVSILPDGRLHLRDVRDTDGMSTYQCHTRNILTGEEKMSSFAYLKVHDPPATQISPTIDDILPDLAITEGDTVELPCVSSQGNPSPTYRWSRDGLDVVINDVRIQQRGGNLKIINSTISDSGLYSCSASNSRGEAKENTKLVVTSSLSVHIVPQEQTVDAGKTAEFNCSVFGHPVDTISWYKNGYLLLLTPRISVQSETLLRIEDVRRQDQGMYQCFVSNDKSKAQGVAQLQLGAAKPAILDALQEQFVQSGTRVSLRCKASGNPIPVVTWLLDGAELPTGDRIGTNSFTTYEGDVISFVNITSVKVEDGGEYTCKALNDVGRAYHIGKLNVYGTPYIRPMKNVTATANEKLSIRCYVSGYPISKITWSKGHDMLPINHWQKVVNGTLIIEKVQKLHDVGKYTCTAQNREGQRDTRDVFVSVVEPPRIDPFDFAKRKQGDRVILSCVVSSGDLPISIHWEKDGAEIPHDLGVKIQKAGSYSSLLSIGDASPMHDGNYTCYASNAAASTNFTAPLHVDVPPRWVVEPHDSFVVLHQSVQLDCQTAGTPDPEVTWRKAIGSSPGDYQTLEFDKDNNHLSLLANGTLVIRHAQENDHGYYLCHSSNGIGYGLSKVVFLTVHIPARFDEPAKNYTVLRGRNITMECQGIGDKPLSISWSTLGSSSSVLSNSRAKVITHNTQRGRLSQLSLQPAIRNDSGIYICNAKNKFDHDSLMIRLIVNEPPEPPLNPDVLNVTSRTITLTWVKPFDGNSPLTAYIIQFKNQSDVWQGVLANVSVPAAQLHVTLSDLHPAFTYDIRVLANNSIGYSRPSEVLSTTTEEEAPTGPPEEVVVKAIGSQALKVTWDSPSLGMKNGKIQGYYIGYKETNSPTHFLYITKKVKVEESESSEHTIHNLKKFTEYTIHIKAYNSKGISPQSADIQVFTLEDVPSQPPQGVQASALGAQTIRVAWSPPPLYTLHGILQGYKILYKPVRFDEDESDANFVTSAKLEAILTRLEKYTNYSIQVLAYTRKGEGVRSEPIYIRTLEDKPESPANIKALAVNSTSILVSWQPPEHPNGVIVRYTLYIRNGTIEGETEERVHLPSTTLHYMVWGLEPGKEYGFRVSAKTMMGDGERTGLAVAAPQKKVAAHIASFPKSLTVPWHQTVSLPCEAIGEPTPGVEWRVRGVKLQQTDRIKVLDNSSLSISMVAGSDAANYTCHAENQHGTDDITYVLKVQVGDHQGTPPQPPRLYLALTTTSTIQVNWLSGSNGGSAIQGFVLNYKKEHGSWKTIHLGSSNRTYISANLLCGTAYKFTLHAFNRLGDSLDSSVVSARTNGSAPIGPPQSMLLKEVNVTSVDLDLGTWLTSGCPIRFYSVKYCVWGDEHWVLVSNSIKPNTTLFTVQDLHPATWYIMSVTAHSDAGSTESELRFATLTYTGSTILPIYVTRKEESEFYEKIYIMVPLCGAVILLMVFGVGVFLYCRRRRDRLRYKETASNLRRDITAETSLMNDLDKRLNVDLDSSNSTTPEQFSKRNVNLLISLHSDDNLNGNSHSWLIHDSSKTNSDNGSYGRSEDEGNINPYATFNEMKAVMAPPSKKQDLLYQKSSDEDEIALQKAAAQREGLSSTPSEPYVPFFHTKAEYACKQEPPPLPATRPPKSKEGYDNQGIILSPRKYASADQIHALFTQGPPRPHSAYKSGSGSSDKGSQRHSVISSVTTVSSSRDELLEALENARRNPPPPILYETPPDDSSQPTDSSVATEPGIRMFTQSPPKPNEQREASCEVPAYEQKRRRQHRMEMESDTTECEGGESHEHRSPPRRMRGRNRGKQRGQIVSKRQMGTSFVPRTQSRTSTTSTNSEEVTYSFAGRDSPHSDSPPEAYGHYPAEGYATKGTKRRGCASGGRGTPHSKVKYDVSLQTPGTDENKPLVMSLAQPSLSSPQEEEEEERVSLLDRHYRPVPESESDGQIRHKDSKGDKGYTEDFTIV
ncbi:Down syndrome cell adhesion molecule homolog [Haliotis rubra]|uniref:Down syndrome cell adhesion molecule homolog n=1 Tax=Haliotis rubra TaxID=36100 RepID=UPI001EE550E7|nr:Down syndrome cell adhesion molecule homolog [Haliotis rubra]